jgi:predicted dehydrogenase
MLGQDTGARALWGQQVEYASDKERTMTKPRLIHVGTGGWGFPWTGISSSSPDWAVVAYVDPSVEYLKAASGAYGLDSSLLYTDFKRALQEREADAVVIVAPPQVHAELAYQAFDAGLDVLVEKPLANTIEDAKAMNEAARQAGAILMVSQNYRYRRSAQTVRALLEEQFLGRIGYIEINFQQAPHWLTEHGYQGFQGMGGYDRYRLIEDMSVHHFDLLRAVTGLEPVSVFARSSNPPWTWFAADAVVHASIEMTNGVLAHYSGSWVTQGEETGYEGDWHIECEHGQIHWTGNEVFVRPSEIYDQLYHKGLLRRRGGYSVAELVDMDREDRWYILAEFASCVTERRTPACSGVDNVATIALTLGVAESARAGAVVAVGEHLDPVDQRASGAPS